MSNFNASITFSLKDLFSSPLQKIDNGIKKLYGTANKSGKTFGAFWDDFNNNAAQSQTAANLALASQAFSNAAAQLNTLIGTPRKVASSFENGMARVDTVLTTTNAIGGDTTATMTAITASARAMAGGVSQAGKLASIGMDTFSNSVYTMLSSGLQTRQAIAATEQAALLAKATGGSMQQAAQALTGIFNNLGDRSADAQTEMTRLSDIIAGTQNYFAFENLQQFTDGLKNVSGIAGSAGIPLTQLSAAIGQLNTNMIRGPEAGTALKSVIAQLGNASNRLGFDIVETADGGLNLIDTLKNIQAVGASTDDLIKGFGTEAGPAVALLTRNIDALGAGLKAVENSAGITLQNASKMADTFATKQEKLNNAWQVYQQRIGAGSIAISGLGISIATAGAHTLNWINDIPLLGEGLAGIAGASLQVGSSFLSFASGSFQAFAGINAMFALSSKIIPMFGILTTTIKFLRTGILTAIPTIWGYVTATWSAVAANIALYWPIYAIAGAIVAVIAIFKNWTVIGGFFSKVWDGITTAVKNAWQWLINILDNPLIATAGIIFAPLITIPALIVKHWQPIKEFFGNLFEWLGNLFNKFGGWIKKIFGGGKAEVPVVEVAGARASGGHVGLGRTYLVGEKGPEIFTPNSSGTIIPNNQLAQTTQSTTTTFNIENLHVAAPNDLQHFITLIKELAKEVGYAHA